VRIGGLRALLSDIDFNFGKRFIFETTRRTAISFFGLFFEGTFNHLGRSCVRSFNFGAGKYNVFLPDKYDWDLSNCSQSRGPFEKFALCSSRYFQPCFLAKVLDSLAPFHLPPWLLGEGSWRTQSPSQSDVFMVSCQDCHSHQCFPLPFPFHVL
jgi:hypothetical protein